MRSPYALLRSVHLGAGLFAALFLAVYAVSAVQMAYPVYRLEPRVTRHAIDLPAELDRDPRPLARWLMAEHGLRGDLRTISRPRGALRLEIVRPGTVHRVVVGRGGRRARVTTERLDAVGMLNRLHHAGGLDHDHWALDAWGWLVLAVSLALLALGGSGVAMWLLRHRRLRFGVPVFVGTLAFGLTLLALVRLG